jgi:CBS-domain-containing membrane protein
MSEQENFAAQREARYRSAFVRYLAAVNHQDEHLASSAHEQVGRDSTPHDQWVITENLVRDVMTQDVVSVPMSATFKDVLDALTVNQIGAVPVVDTDHVVLGMVSESDLLIKVVTGGDPRSHLKGGASPARRKIRHKADAETAEGLMTAPAVTIRADYSVVQAARTAALERVRGLPVVDEHARLIGIVTRSDLLSVFDRSDEAIGHYLMKDMMVCETSLVAAGIGAAVQDGVVTLTGQVEHGAFVAKEHGAFVAKVVDAVRSTTGVVGVHNEVACQPGDLPQETLGPLY